MRAAGQPRRRNAAEKYRISRRSPTVGVGARLAIGLAVTNDRRAYRRIGGSAVPWLSAWVARTAQARILDISDGGMLLDVPKLVRPGQREVVLLRGTATTKVAGWAERVEIVRLKPNLSYRTALRFCTPLIVRALGETEFDRMIGAELVPGTSQLVMGNDRVFATTFESWVCGLPGVQAASVSAAVMRMPGTEAIHFSVPPSSQGEKRLLQVFFAPGTLPTADEFAQLRELAELASSMPDVRIARTWPAHAVATDRRSSATSTALNARFKWSADAPRGYSRSNSNSTCPL
jgi:hypothetical protein